MLRNAGVTSDVGIWSDHRSLEACFQLYESGRVRKWKRKRTFQWKHVDKAFFETKTEELLGNHELSTSLHTRCQQVEKALVEAAMKSSERYESQAEQMDETVKNLMERRNALPGGSTERKELSKQIQREIRRERRAKQHQQIGETLEKFENLKSIPRIKTVKKRILIVKNGQQGWKDGE